MRVSIGDSARIPGSLPDGASGVPVATASSASGSSPFARLLHGFGNELTRGEATMRAAVDSMRTGGDFAPSQLIALQAGVYRYSEAIDVASRVVDRTASGIKAVLQGGGS